MTFFDKIKDLHLLLIDDDEWIRDSMRLFFESEGCDLVTMETAEQAMDLVKKEPFDVIISDFRLPGIDGIEFFRRTPRLNDSSLKILITAYMNKSVAIEAKKAGIHDLIEKPFTPETIEKSLSKLLSKASTTE